MTNEERQKNKNNYVDFAIFLRIPCIAENQVGGCPDFRLPTREEVKAYEAQRDEEIKAFLEKMMVVRPAIVKDVEDRGMTEKFCEGEIECPACGGLVQYVYHGHVNKHIQAVCSTKGCVEWVE